MFCNRCDVMQFDFKVGEMRVRSENLIKVLLIHFFERRGIGPLVFGNLAPGRMHCNYVEDIRDESYKLSDIHKVFDVR